MGKSSYTEAEDNLLLSLLHSNYPGGQSDVYRSFREIADLMNEQAPGHGITTERVYKSCNIYTHYMDYLKPKYLLEARRPTPPFPPPLQEPIYIGDAPQIQSQQAAQETATSNSPVPSLEAFHLPNNCPICAAAGPPYKYIPLGCRNPYHSFECFGGSVSGCQPLHRGFSPPPRRLGPFTDVKKYDYFDISEGKGKMNGESAGMRSEQSAASIGSSTEVEEYDYLDYYGVSKGKGKMGDKGQGY
jgi:hypothetical protein